MDNWKIQLVVVTFCALLQTYQGLSSSVDEESGLSKNWQVSISNLNTVIDTYDLIVFIGEMLCNFWLSYNKYQGVVA